MPEDLGTIRKHKGMSISKLAARSGVSIAKLVQYEKGERPIPSSEIARIAKALYVSEWDINRQSTPPPPPEAPQEKKAKPPRQKQKAKRKKKGPPPSPPARETQIEHLLTIATKFDEDREALEQKIGKPLEELTQKEAREWNHTYNKRWEEQRSEIDRKRAYLPEGVDGFEANYLQEQQANEALLHFTLFDGQTFEGTVIGFSPYHIMIRQPGGDEITLNKLAIAYYRKAAEGSEQ